MFNSMKHAESKAFYYCYRVVMLSCYLMLTLTLIYYGVILFRDFLTGFHKRKVERKKNAEKLRQDFIQKERLILRKQVRCMCL